MEDVVQVSDEPRSVHDILREKHPQAQPAAQEALLEGEARSINPVIFDSLTAALIRQTALHAKGSAGPSGLDSHAWRRICSRYRKASDDICTQLAALGRLLSTHSVDPVSLSPLVACRLVALDKNPGVRPIGVGEVIRRIVTKAILRVVQRLVQEACGVLQTCYGLPCGIEAAVHAMRETYAANSTEGILLVDATNAFNSLNREAALHNIQHLCPAISTLACNTYGAPARLFVSGGGELASQEGTTQGDPLSMALYTLSILPMQWSLLATHPQTMQLWYADDYGAAGRVRRLRAWWDSLVVLGPKYGYHPNGHKTKLLVKPGLQQQAEEIFGGTGITVVTDGATYLGSPIGTPEHIAIQATKKVAEWSREINRLASLAVTEPHAAYAVLTHGLYGRWTYHFCTMEFPPDSLQPLVDAITSSLLPALTGRDSWPEIALQQMFLPVRCGGLGLPDVANVAASEYTASIHVCAAYMNAILQQTAHPPHQPKSLKWLSRIAEVVQEIRDAVAAAKAEVKSEKRAIVR